jgi:hypothetical protein
VPASDSHQTVRDGKTTRRSNGHAPIQVTHKLCSSRAFFCPSDAVPVVVADVIVVVVVVLIIIAVDRA